MNKNKEKQIRKSRRAHKIRSKISGTNICPRLSVFKSNTSVYLQIIDDQIGKTLASAHSREVKEKKENKEFEVGKLIAEKAIKLKIKEVVFDRGGNKYHGRVKLVAEGARAGGLKF